MQTLRRLNRQPASYSWQSVLSASARITLQSLKSGGVCLSDLLSEPSYRSPRKGPDISLHQAFSSNATVSIALGGSNLFFWSREVQGPTKRLYSKKGSGSSHGGGGGFADEDIEVEEEDGGLVDEGLPSVMLNDGLNDVQGLELAGQLKDIPEGSEDSTGAIKTVNLGPYPSELSEWLRQFKVKLVDVNRVSKGSPTGRISQFSALTVAGNKDGIVGLGMGKANGIGDAIKKANRQAVKTLFYVPRYNKATILHPIVSKYGKCIVKMYPKSSGRGCAASPMMKDICKLAGLRDVGVKTYGSRNIRNTIKAFIRGLESQVPLQEQRELPDALLKPSRRPKGTPTVQTVGLLSV